MRQHTQEFLISPNPEIGGANIPIVGPPGCGKTVSLTKLGLNHLDKHHFLLWRGTKQAQWAHFLANDVKVILWNHEGIDDFRAVITGSRRKGIPEKDIDLESKGVEIREWSDEKELVESLEPDAVNVVNVPGLQGDDGTDYHMYFFRMKWVDILDAVIERSYGDFITVIMDEMGDLFPSQQQLRKPFYRIVRQLPPKLAQLRKNNAWLFGAAHSTHDVHYFFWKIKSNSVAYMSGANVKNELSPSVNQKGVNQLDRGEILMPGPDIDEIVPPNLMEDLDWVPGGLGRKVRLRWTSNPPNLLDESEEGEDTISIQEVKRATYTTIAKRLYNEFDWEQKDIAEVVEKSQSTVSRMVSDDTKVEV